MLPSRVGEIELSLMCKGGAMDFEEVAELRSYRKSSMFQEVIYFSGDPF